MLVQSHFKTVHIALLVSAVAEFYKWKLTPVLEGLEKRKVVFLFHDIKILHLQRCAVKFRVFFTFFVLTPCV